MPAGVKEPRTSPACRNTAFCVRGAPKLPQGLPAGSPRSIAALVSTGWLRVDPTGRVLPSLKTLRGMLRRGQSWLPMRDRDIRLAADAHCGRAGPGLAASASKDVGATTRHRRKIRREAVFSNSIEAVRRADNRRLAARPAEHHA